MSLSIKQLTKIYGQQKAIDNISFDVKEGEILGFLGPNGAGKSTTMKIATCYIAPTSGTVEVAGYNVLQNPIEVRRHVGYLPEHNPLYLDMYVHEYLEFIASLHQIPYKQTKKRIAEVIELVGLGKEQNKQINALSKGYRQRVGLAQALIHNPKVLILDEPTTGLDPNQILEIRNVIKQISHDKTVIFSTHIMQEVQALCSRVIIIKDGKIVADSPTEALGQASQQINIYVEFEQLPENWKKISLLEHVITAEATSENHIHITASEDIRRGIFEASVQNGWILIGIAKDKASLEGVFKELTSN